MNKLNDQEWRQERLSQLAAEKGGAATLGRLLGYNNGAYIGQMISGHRPITEKFIHKVHALHRLNGWFDRDLMPTKSNTQEAGSKRLQSSRACLDALEAALMNIESSTREEIGVLLSHFARGLRPTTKEAIIALIDGSGNLVRQRVA